MTDCPGRNGDILRDTCDFLWLSIEAMDPKGLELPQESTVGQGKACYLVSLTGEISAPRKKSHTVLTISQTTLQDGLEFRQTDRQTRGQ